MELGETFLKRYTVMPMYLGINWEDPKRIESWNQEGVCKSWGYVNRREGKAMAAFDGARALY